MKIEEGVQLSRLTTLGTGGPARAFARPETIDELQDALRMGARQRARRRRDRLGSNLLVADDGFDGLALKLGGRARAADVEGELLVAGGGAPNAVSLHRARAAGLGGFEFACAIPGTAGGGVWMNAGAYGGDWAAVLERALVVDAGRGGLAHAERARTFLPALGAPARPGGRPRRVPAHAPSAGRDQGGRRRPAGPAESGAADEQAHVRERLQESRARALRGPPARGLRPERPPDRRRADLAAARELHRERRRGALRGCDRADGRGAAAGLRTSSASSSGTRSSSSARSSFRPSAGRNPRPGRRSDSREREGSAPPTEARPRRAAPGAFGPLARDRGGCAARRDRALRACPRDIDVRGAGDRGRRRVARPGRRRPRRAQLLPRPQPRRRQRRLGRAARRRTACSAEHHASIARFHTA